MKVFSDFDLTAYNTFGIMARAEFFSAIQSIDELPALNDRFRKENKLVLGGGSNLLLTKNLAGIVLHNRIPGISVFEEDDTGVFLQAGAGVVWHDLVMYAVKNGWGGLENLSLIPGKVGAAPIQNIGAYGVELCDVFECLEAFHLESGEVHLFRKSDCAFGYRNSVFKNKFRGQYVILNLTVRLKKSPEFKIEYGAIRHQLSKMNVSQLSVKAISEAVIEIRRNKLPDPTVIGNAGSFFKNPVVDSDTFHSIQNRFPDVPHYLSGVNYKIPAAWLIEQCGFKGLRVGNTGCFEKQPLVIVNYGNATGQEIFNFSENIINKVHDRFAITLEREVNVI